MNLFKRGVFQVVFQDEFWETKNASSSPWLQDNLAVQDALDVVKPRELTPIGVISAYRLSWGSVALESKDLQRISW